MTAPSQSPLIKPELKQTAIWLGVALVFIYVLNLLAPILTPFVFAAILAYILHPGVNWLISKRIPKAVAVALVILLLFLGVTIFVLLVISVLQREIPLLKEQVPNLISKITTELTPRLAEFGIPLKLDFSSLKQLLTEQLSGSGEEIASKALAALKGSSGAVLGLIGNAVLIPLVLFYLLMDWTAMIGRIDNAIPQRWRAKVRALASETDELLSQYLRGQVLVMIVLAIYYSLCLWIAHFDVALPVGIFTGLAIVIPYIGFGIGLVLALLAAMLQFGNMYGFIAVACIYGAGQVIEGFFLTPRLVGERIGLHPLAVLFALLAFGQLFGFFGVLLALPASAILLVALRQLRAAYLASSFYKQ